MKPISSALPQLQTGGVMQTGTPRSEHGLAIAPSGEQKGQAEKPPGSPAAMKTALEPLTGWLTAYREVPIGQTIGDKLTEEQRQSALSTLRPLAARGEPVQVLRIVQRLLALYPGKTFPDSVAEDWVRVLKDMPLASIWEVYERTIRKPGQFAPAIGDFYTDVKTHADMVDWVIKSIEGKKA